VTLPSALVAEEAEDEQLELLLSALDEMNYPEEYALLATVYIHRLVSRGLLTLTSLIGYFHYLRISGKVRRLHAYKNALTHIPTNSNIDVNLALEEISSLLNDYPLIKRELVELESPSNADDDFYMEEDLGFLSGDV
jgi:hypothetical protein